MNILTPKKINTNLALNIIKSADKDSCFIFTQVSTSIKTLIFVTFQDYERYSSKVRFRIESLDDDEKKYAEGTTSERLNSF